MKISNGTVKNINKKLIAGILAISLSTTLTGCGSSYIRDINYTRDENEYINGFEGTIAYWNLEKCNFIKVHNNITDEEYYTIGLTDGWSEKLYDLFTRQYLEDSKVFEVEYLDTVYTWINALGMSKDCYTEEELRELLNIFIEKQEEKDKQLVKE